MAPVLALSVRQPYAELILRGIKTVEYRSRPTRVVGERFYLYASKGRGAWGARRGGERAADRDAAGWDAAGRIWSDDLAVPGPKTGEPPAWLVELAEELVLGKLPSGVIVGSAVIEKVTPGDGIYHWHLRDVERTPRLRKPTGHPQPVWFRPF